MQNCLFSYSAFILLHFALHKESRRHRNQLRMLDQGMSKNPPEGAFPLWDSVDRAREPVVETVVQPLERLLDAVVLEMILAEHAHPRVVVAPQSVGAGIALGDRLCRRAPGEPARLHRVHDAAA